MSEQGPTVFNGRYELLRHIARGGMADVYLARDELLGRLLKAFGGALGGQPRALRQAGLLVFERGALLGQQLVGFVILSAIPWSVGGGEPEVVLEAAIVPPPEDPFEEPEEPPEVPEAAWK